MKQIETESRGDKRIRLTGQIVIIFTICLLTSLIMEYTLDDALIYYRYIDNAISGNGLVYNSGEYFNGLTSPLFTYLSVAVNYLTNNIPATQMILSAIFMALTCIILIEVSRQNKIPAIYAIAGAALIAANRFLYLTFGMETMMFLFLSALTLYLFFREDYFAMGISAAALYLTRGESIFLLSSLVLLHFVLKRKFPSWKVFIIPLLLIAGNYLFNYFYYGEFMPNTVKAKMWQGDSGLWRSLPFLRVSHYIYQDANRFFPLSLKEIMVGLYGFLALAGLISSLRKSVLLQALVLFLVQYTAFYLIFNIPGYQWYYAPYFMAGSVFISYGLLWIYNAVGKYLKGKAPAIICAVLFLALFGSFFAASVELMPGDKGTEGYKQAGLWLHDNTPARAKVACVEIGHIGWYSKRYIIDILGLVNLKNAELIGQRKFSDWLLYYDPDYVFLHNPLWDHEQGITPSIKSGRFVNVPEFNIEGYTLLKKNPEWKIAE